MASRRYHVSTPAQFFDYFPLPPQALDDSLSVSASTWTNAHLSALRVLQVFTDQIPFPIPDLLSETLLSELSTFTDGTFRQPRHELINTTLMHGFFSHLASVLERPPTVIESLHGIKNRQDRTGTILPTGFVPWDGIQLSSSPPTTSSASSDHSASVHMSQVSMESSSVSERKMDERATAAMAIAFLEGVVSLSRASNPPSSDILLEFTPVSSWVSVTTAGFSFTAVDDGGLVARHWSSGGEWVKIGSRVCSIECKSRIENRIEIHQENVVAQQAGEMVALMYERLRNEGVVLDGGEEGWDGERVQKMQRRVVVLCFAQNLMVVKSVLFSTQYLKWLFLRYRFADVGPPIPEQLEMDVDAENDENGKYDENEDNGMVEECDDDKEQWQEGEEGDEEENDLFLRIECGPIHDLSVADGRIDAAAEVLGVVNYFQSSIAAEANLNQS